jgi:hypothetical protein
VPVNPCKKVTCHSVICVQSSAGSSKMWLVWLCFISCIVFSVAHDSDVYTIQYTSDTFSVEVPKKNHFVMFFAPW